MEFLSYYELKRIDYLFLDFIDHYISKYPFKFYYIMETLNKKEIVYIKDTTMIIDLIKLEEDMIVNIFELFKELLRRNVIKKIVYKKEVLLVYFNCEFIISFFKSKDKWLIIPLVVELMKNKENIYFDVYIKSVDVYKVMCLVKIKEKYISIDLNNINKINEMHIPLVICFNNNKNNNLQFSFNKSVFINNLMEKIN